jgi:luciferase family oxidoreductase group 1
MGDLPALPLSVLDVLPVGVGSTPAAVLDAGLNLARHVEGLGFTRYWVAEHHSSPSIASSSPSVVIAALGQATSTIRIGSGGVMLPNHVPFVVAEQFGTLNALYPGRVDLGVGRSPIGDPRLASALRVQPGPAAGANFAEQLGELIGFLLDDFPENHPFHGVSATPTYTTKPSVWLLGSSENGARMAAELGLPFAFAHHFSPRNSAAAIRLYHRLFRPSEFLSQPYSIIAVSVLCAEDDATAEWLAAPSGLAYVRAASSPPQPLPTPEQAAAHPFTPEERAWLENNFLAPQAVGGPDRVRRRLGTLLEESGASELMVVTLMPNAEETIHSIDRVRDMFGDASLPKGLAL